MGSSFPIDVNVLTFKVMTDALCVDCGHGPSIIPILPYSRDVSRSLWENYQQVQQGDTFFVGRLALDHSM